MVYLIILLTILRISFCCTSTSTKDGWEFCFMKQNKNWYDAEEWCRGWKANGHLASIHTDSIRSHVYGKIAILDYWVGANNFDYSGGNGDYKWDWTNGQSFWQSSGSPPWYGFHEPDNWDSQHCVQFRSSLSWIGLCTQSCSNEKYFVCSRPISGGANPWDNVNWGPGTEIHCDLTQDACPEKFSKCHGVNHLSACSAPKNGTCVDYNVCECKPNYETPLESCAFWKCGSKRMNDPSICGGNGNCVAHDECQCTNQKIGLNCDTWECFEIDKSSSSVCSSQHGTCDWWDDCVCSHMYMGRSCQFDAVCRGVGEIEFIEDDGKKVCYKHSTNFEGALTWFESESRCQQWNDKAHLVSITGSSKNTWLDNSFPTLFWTGANNLVNSSHHYDFTNGDLFDFTNWKNGEESNYNIQQNCVLNQPGNGWTSELCDSVTYHFVCSYPICEDIDQQHCQVVNVWDNVEWISAPPHVKCSIEDRDDQQSDQCPSIFSTCFGVKYDDYNDVCSGRGECISFEECSCDDDYFGDDCSVTFCNGVLSNDTKICSGHGSCFPKDNCVCNHGYYEENMTCSMFSCFGILQNESSVCSNHGKCTGLNRCACNENYYSSDCSISTCYGILSNYSDYVCSNRGTCEDFNICDCNEGYFGDRCSNGICFGIPGNQTDVSCAGNGVCDIDNKCRCFEGYFSSNCTVPSCFGVLSNDSNNDYCSGHGRCLDLDICQCSDYFYGSKCSIIECFGILSNETESVCSGHGSCVLSSQNNNINFCECEENYYGTECEITTCKNIWSNDSLNEHKLCHGRGSCDVYNLCKCHQPNLYSGVDCENTTCGGYTFYDTNNVCSGHGTCVEYETCECDESGLYSGHLCDEWKCYGNSRLNLTHVCSGNGICSDHDKCVCVSDVEYQGLECEIFKCGMFFNYNVSYVCNNRGICRKFNQCICDNDYKGNMCETWECDSIRYDDNPEIVCSGNGMCEYPNRCKCNENYKGDVCSIFHEIHDGGNNDEELEKNNSAKIIAGVLVPSFFFIVIFGIFLFVCSCCILLLCMLCWVFLICFCLWLFFSTTTPKQRESINSLIFLKERLLLGDEDDEGENGMCDGEKQLMNRLQVDKTLFKIKMKELVVKKVLGQGGSNSTVYLTLWNKRECAFKVFRTHQIFGGPDSESNFEEFERESKVMSSVSHPNILQYYGSVLEPPRIGIVMEYCKKGDLRVFLGIYKINNPENKTKMMYPIFEKIRMFHEIVNAMMYLHERSVVHRDLKPENILINHNEHCKVTDFGLSKITTLSTAKTKRIGTMYYMSPEVTNGTLYDERCDVYSFGILMYVILTEKWKPFGEESDDSLCIELKVASDPNFRPDIEILRNLSPDDDIEEWIVELIMECWNHDPLERKSFHEIDELMTTEIAKKYSNSHSKNFKIGGGTSMDRMYKSLRSFGKLKGKNHNHNDEEASMRENLIKGECNTIEDHSFDDDDEYYD